MPNYFQRLEQSLAQRRRSKGDLAAHLGVALSTVSRWRDAVPRADTVQKTAEFLGVDAKWLLTGEGFKKPSDDPARNVECETKVKDENLGQREKSVEMRLRDLEAQQARIRNELETVAEAIRDLALEKDSRVDRLIGILQMVMSGDPITKLVDETSHPAESGVERTTGRTTYLETMKNRKRRRGLPEPGK